MRRPADPGRGTALRVARWIALLLPLLVAACNGKGGGGY